MADIISFQKAKEKRKTPENTELSELLKQAYLACSEKSNWLQDKLNVVNNGDLKSIFESKINQEIFTKKLISSDVFLCGMYVSNLLGEFMSNSVKSWWAVDYAASDDPLVFKKGADVCFIICGVFPGRGNHRMMKVAYYQEMGESYYYHFYTLAKKEIGYHMSNKFELMTRVVKSCIQNF